MQIVLPVNVICLKHRTLSHNSETKDFARPTSHSVRGWTGRNKAFCSPATQNGRRVTMYLASNTRLSIIPNEKHIHGI